MIVSSSARGGGAPVDYRFNGFAGGFEPGRLVEEKMGFRSLPGCAKRRAASLKSDRTGFHVASIGNAVSKKYRR
ncbi:MAG TPA: hypothetical protein VJS18_11650 [Paraburkholderia sp.]|nr:hypothetical protein [Paraburkholderia sp.]